ncbi:DUF6752 domain-containing protein [Nocardioides daphniae]|uniref:DUF6752 domain-containing protein n=1 Tax=Nocardioides daphniae TaxID=402297 RepID=A0ABQ1QI60_9ACTN|nr:DUF6752 domain-containing protein [Nocardioides daphniae]GGD27975.1 hypothetical protein GCM10007231_29340 [Nocardioides daphniae]
MDKVKQLLKSSLRARVEVLEQEVQESRQLNMRLAELLDVVTELLVPLAERDEEAARRLLADYRNEVDSTMAGDRVERDDDAS